MTDIQLDICEWSMLHREPLMSPDARDAELISRVGRLKPIAFYRALARAVKFSNAIPRERVRSAFRQGRFAVDDASADDASAYDSTSADSFRRFPCC